MRWYALFYALLAAPFLTAAPDIFPLKDVRAGQKGVGRTVFSGSKVEEFQVEVLGVLENIGPRQSIILARLSGGPLAETGVMQGMSGSPVYIGGRLAGAVALGFPYSKQPIAGIRPIEEMLRVDPAAPGTVAAAAPPRRQFLSGDARLEEIATPVSFSGFTAQTLEHFAPELRTLGMDPRQGITGGGRVPDRLGDPSRLEPGSMISVQLLAGDMSVSADGTVTAIDGNRIYAFGHRFLAGGPTELPFARAEVLALLPSLSSSFKISQAQEWMGAITQDRDTAISGVTGRRAVLVPVTLRVGSNTYSLSMIQDRVMTPLVAQMAVFSALDATGRAVGSAAVSLNGQLAFEGGTVNIDNVYSGDLTTAALASLGVASPLSYAMASGFDALRLKSATINIDSVDRRRQTQIASLVGPRAANPGDLIDLTVVFAGENGAESSQTVQYRIPLGAPTGTLTFTASDATTANLTEFQSALATPYRSAEQVLGVLNGLRGNTKAYVRVLRNAGSFVVEGRDLPDPPPSVSMILQRAQAGAAPLNLRGAKVAELEVPAGGLFVTGSRSIQVEVKE